MGVLIKGTYAGGLAAEMTHTPSGTTLLTDPPVDNGGKGASFSPTDLLATAYGSCMISVMALQAKREGWDLTGTKVDVEKHMTTALPRRVARLCVQLTLPARLDPQVRDALVKTARECPVALSVSSDIIIDFKLVLA